MKVMMHWGIVMAVIISSTTTVSATMRQAVVIVPVADLLKAPLSQVWRANNVADAYERMPYCHVVDGDNKIACPRTHQELFNTIVDVIEQCNDEWCVQMPNLFLIDKITGTPRNSFWTHCKNLMLLDEHDAHGIGYDVIPQSIRFFDQNSVCDCSIVTLTEPFMDPVTGMHFSVGTRFVRAGEQAPDGIPVFLLRDNGRSVGLLYVPDDRCVVGCPTGNEERVSLYVALLRKWAHELHGMAIPYVWGGGSFIAPIDCARFERHTGMFGGVSAAFFGRLGREVGIKVGFDCSGIILRAAQIFGIPYFYKNSHTVPHYLEHLDPSELPQNGDIIQYKGHVLVISDRDNNLALEACGYDPGYGVVQELPLARIFNGITTYEQLVHHLHERLPIERLAADGCVARRLDTFTILKIRSAWHVVDKLPVWPLFGS